MKIPLAQSKSPKNPKAKYYHKLLQEKWCLTLKIDRQKRTKGQVSTINKYYEMRTYPVYRLFVKIL